jgi:outer membrane immunogenic protein
MKKLLLGSVAIAAITLAVDGPAKAAPPATYSWTGCYIGGNVGGGWARKQFTPGTVGTGGEGSAALSDFVAGGQFGCDVQNGMWVFGAQGMFDWTNMSVKDPFFSSKAFSTRVPWFGTATGRIGYLARPDLIVFIKGGAAFARDEHKFIEAPSFIDGTAHVTRSGWTLGGGADWRFNQNWSVTIEYGYMGFGTDTVAFQGVGGFSNFSERVGQHMQVVLVGLNYRFGSWGGR